jgi:hypothetical protein
MRKTAVVTLAAATGLGLVADARADLALLFGKPRARWGERLHVRSPGRYAPFSGVRVYLVPMALAHSARVQRPTGPPRNRRIVPLASVRLRRPGILRVAFRVPHVRPGNYTIGFWCRPCAPPRGSFFTTARPHQRWTPSQHKIVRITRR